jgi:AcrR family transcriptional regulator
MTTRRVKKNLASGARLVLSEIAKIAAPRAPARGKYDRAQTKQERRREQYARLLDAASHVFAEKGWASATVEAIVDDAGMSRRTFYEHFADLKSALLELHDEAAKVLFAYVEAEVRRQDEPIEKLRAGVTAFLALIGEHGDLARVLFREVRAAGPEHEVRRQAVLARFAALLFEGVAEAYARGVAARPPDEVRIFALVAGMEAIGMRYLERREEARAVEAAPVLVDLVVRAFS